MSDTEKTIAELRKQIQMMQRGQMIEKTTLLNTLKNHFGPEVVDVVSNMVAEKTRQQWSMIAERHGSNTIDDLIKILWEPLLSANFEFTVERQKDGVQIHCTRCPLYDMAKELGTTDWGLHMNCITDQYIVEGFNPKMGFRRTKTLMEGHNCCDHFYYMKDQ